MGLLYPGKREGQLPIRGENGTIACVPPDACPPGVEIYVTSDGRIDCIIPIP